MSLVVDDLHRRYGATRAVDGVSFELPEGAVLALLGPSGCGKSTLLRLLAGLEPPDAGRIALDGRDLTRVPPRGRGFGMVFQDYALFPHLDVRGNVAFGLVEQRVPRAAREARVAELLELVGLEGFERRRVQELSGGQRQRVALARALAPRPEVLLLDEPLSNLDRGLREQLEGELRALLSGLDVRAVHVTHDQGEAMSIAATVAVMRAGRIVQLASRDELWSRPRTPWVARFLGHRNVYERGAPGAGARGPALLRADLARLHPADGPGAPAVARSVLRRGLEVTVDLEVPEWEREVRWEGFARELPAGLADGAELRLDAPEAAWVPLDPDAPDLPPAASRGPDASGPPSPPPDPGGPGRP